MFTLDWKWLKTDMFGFYFRYRPMFPLMTSPSSKADASGNGSRPLANANRRRISPFILIHSAECSPLDFPMATRLIKGQGLSKPEWQASSGCRLEGRLHHIFAWNCIFISYLASFPLPGFGMCITFSIGVVHAPLTL
ncbi:hypothetical protein M440DRAFT_306177 [Trichoderma longibrachiatum ATCC 18648]|uniref:Uncharacterized protein n=1 Tax=Trichoderma longibrachiatum ATCC 18648 TaxID=983965 RepID=A0A2T4C5U0_TRILO|nr:hypothetical protein M440DRAFT_306177 [Trichoderma longibrachiatum ATCC 18648]